MNKKGFTLVELLAVVAILGIMVLIALPNVIDSFNESKNNTFISESQGLYKAAKNQYVLDTAKGISEIAYVHGYNVTLGTDKKELNTANREGFKYLIKINTDGEIYYFLVEDNDHKIELGNIDNDNYPVNFQDIERVGLPTTPSSQINPSSSVISPSTQTPTSTLPPVSNSGLTPGRLSSCDAGYYLSSGSCLICEAGYYCTGGINGPTICPAGTSSAEGAKNVRACSLPTPDESLSFTVLNSRRFDNSNTLVKTGFSYSLSSGKTNVNVYMNNVNYNAEPTVQGVYNASGVYKVFVSTLTGMSSIGTPAIEDRSLSIEIDGSASSVVVYLDEIPMQQITPEEAGLTTY